MWSKSKLRDVMLFFKPSLLSLFTSSNSMTAKKVLLHAADRFLLCLLYILYNLAIGNISIDKKLYPKLFKSHRASFLFKKISTKAKLNRLLNSTREEQLKFLSQFSGQFPILLKRLFSDSEQNENPAIQPRITEEGQHHTD